MLTQRKAKKLLSSGEHVYTVEGGQLVNHKVKKILDNSLKVEDGVLYYDELGDTWFLSPYGAATSVGAKVKVTYSLEFGGDHEF